MSYDASGKMLEEWHGNGIKTVNRYHPTRGFLESTRTLRVATNADIQETEMQLDDLGKVRTGHMGDRLTGDIGYSWCGVLCLGPLPLQLSND